MSSKNTTRILKRAREGDVDAAAELFPLVYDELRNIAAAYFQRQPVGHTLQPTALVHEAYLRLVDENEIEWEDRSHFLGISARVMRLVLVDHTRRRQAVKRGGGAQRVPLTDLAATGLWKGVDILALGEALEELEKLDVRRAQVVDLRVFLGMTVKEAAEVLGVSPKTVEKDWAGARAWLRVALDRP